jgi:protein gp37
MGKDSSIQWTNATWNPWHGCRKVSAGCKFCYMYRDKERYGQDPTTVLKSKTNFRAPLSWPQETRLVFTCSWSDWFIEEADSWRAEAWDIIKRTPWFTYQILTKRPERILECLPADWGAGYANVWLGVSVEDQAAADKRIPILLQVPAAIRFLSCEPLLGPLTLEYIEAPDKIPGERWTFNCFQDGDVYTFHSDGDVPGTMPGDGPLRETAIDWVIVGGESGNDTGKYSYRTCEMEWISDIIQDCLINDVPVFVKQMGTSIAKRRGLVDRHGGDINEWPDEFKIHQFPQPKTAQ